VWRPNRLVTLASGVKDMGCHAATGSRQLLSSAKLSADQARRNPLVNPPQPLRLELPTYLRNGPCTRWRRGGRFG
jgi:hypothetical protein